MTETQSHGDDPRPPAGRPGYYIVRVRPDGATGELAGLVERLSTGEKRAFRSYEELARVVEEWSK
jgi:hypothetical protein